MTINLLLGHTRYIREKCAMRGLTRHQTAYVLATAYHETDGKMTPVVENLRYSTAERIRAVWPSRFPTLASARGFVLNPEGLANKVYGGRLGNHLADDGWTFRGRGHVQITGRENYAKAGSKLGLNLQTNPDAALHPDTASRILVQGMQEGWFTGRKLSDYIGAKVDYREARRIVNVLDRADDIAELARGYEFAIAADAPAPATPSNIWTTIIAAIARLFKGA